MENRVISRYKIETICPECRKKVNMVLDDNSEKIFQIGSIFFDVDRDGETKRRIKRNAFNLKSLEEQFKNLEKFGIKMEKREDQDFNKKKKETILVYLYTFKKYDFVYIQKI